MDQPTLDPEAPPTPPATTAATTTTATPATRVARSPSTGMPLPITASNIQLHNAQYPASASNYAGHVQAFTTGGSITSPISPRRTTHAGGIQPSASFFRPVRPSALNTRFGPQRPRYGESEDEYSDAEQLQSPTSAAAANVGGLHPLSINVSLSHSSSLSAHQHHHSNHSSELVRAHEDGPTQGASHPTPVDAHGEKTVQPKMSKEPLLPPGTAAASSAQGQAKSKRVSIDLSSSLPPPRSPSSPTQMNNPILGQSTKRNSRLGGFSFDFDSIRRSMDSTGGGGRFSFSREASGQGLSREGSYSNPRRLSNHRLSGSFVPPAGQSGNPTITHSREGSYGRSRAKRMSGPSTSAHGHGVLLESGSDGEGSRQNHPKQRRKRLSVGGEHDGDIPLTPRSGTRQSRKRSRRSHSPSSSRSSSISGSISSITEPSSFDPTPPLLAKGQYPKQKTPLAFPFDASLVPDNKLEMLSKRKGRAQRRGDSGRSALENGRTKLGSEGSLTMPSASEASKEQPKTKAKRGFLNFLIPRPEDEIPPSPSTPSRSRRIFSSIFGSFSNPYDQPAGTPVRRYLLHPSRNSFFFNGRIMTGGDEPWAFVFTICVVCALAGLWFGCVGRWWWVEAGLGVVDTTAGGNAQTVTVGDRTLYVINSAARRAGKAVTILCAYAAALVLSSMFVTAFSDPGILPRNLDPDPPYPADSPLDSTLRTPMPRDLKVRSDIVRVKYCPTCRIYRPPRCSHCKMCDNCVDACDHHCQWLNNCIGRRNYTTFFVSLMSGVLTLIMIIVTSALQLFYLSHWQDLSFGGALRRSPGTAVVFCLAIIVIWPVGALLSYHMRLLLLNTTTIEQIRNQAHKSLGAGPAPPNPFSHGSWRKNFLAVLCRPQPLSWLDASAIATEDRREINPGMMLDNAELKREAPSAALRKGVQGKGGDGGWEDMLNIRRKEGDDDDDD